MSRKPQAKRREHFGQIDKQRSGRYRARYLHPADKTRFISAPATFETVGAAREWLTLRKAEIANGTWRDPDEVAVEKATREVTFAAYAAEWIRTRTNSQGKPLRLRTREEYERLLRGPDPARKRAPQGGPLAEFRDTIVGRITPAMVRDWRARQIETGNVTQTSNAYGLLKAIMGTAVADKLVSENPCQIRGGAHASTGIEVLPPTDEELEVVLHTLGELRPRYRALVIAAAVGSLRWGEATALTAADVAVERDATGDVHAVRLTVSKQVVWSTEKGVGAQVAEVKALASNRTVAIFGDDAKIIAAHVSGRLGKALLFPSETDATQYLHATTFHRWWAKAREAAGRPDLRFHALRHYAGTSYAQAGATVKETMARLGHSSTQAAMRYQHAGNRDDELAARLARRTTA